MRSYEDYYYPGTATLKNKFGVRDTGELARIEALLTRIRSRQGIGMVDLTPEGLQFIHNHLFQDLYDWAGEFRTVDLLKLRESDNDAVQFAPGYRVGKVEVPRYFHELREDMESGAFDKLDKDTFAYRSAVYVADLNYIHPFPDGNGRVQRLILDQIAQRSGYRFNHTKLNRKEWIAASMDSYGQDDPARGSYGPHQKMTAVIASLIEVRDRPRDEESAKIQERVERAEKRRKERNQDKDHGHER